MMPYVIEMTTRAGLGLMGYGATQDAAWADARRQVAGGTASMRTGMTRRMIGRPVSDETASEIEEMLGAEVEWVDVGQS